MKHTLIAACLAGFALAVASAYAQNDAMSGNASSMSKGQAQTPKDPAGHDAMSRDSVTKKGGMAKQDMKKGATASDSLSSKPMKGQKPWNEKDWLLY